MKISIITVTFNAEKTLARTLQSVASQSWTDVEHIVMDGASKDGTVAMAEEYRHNAAYGVTVVSEPDKGLYDAMNKAMALATGDYMVMLNAGDTLHDNDTLQQVALTAERSMKENRGKAPGVIYGDTAIVDEEGAFLHLRRLRPPKTLTWRSFKHGMTVCHQSFYVHRDIAQPYDLQYRFSADFDWCIRCMKEGERIGMMNIAVPKASVQTNEVADEAFAPLTNYLNEGMTTANHKASLRERMHIMAKHYGWGTTVAMHLWFVVRSIVCK